MFCLKCGRPLADHSQFCTSCGTKTFQTPSVSSGEGSVETQPTVPPLPPPPPPTPITSPVASPVYQASGVSAPSSLPVSPVMDQPVRKMKKKKPIGCIVTLSILLVLLLVLGWFIASIFGLFGPRDLGVRYTEKDYQSAMAKLGTEVSFNGMSGDELRDYTKDLKKSGKQLAIDDYTWTYSDFEEKSFELTPDEATALLNEIAPAFVCFEDAQVKVLANGDVEASGKLLLKKALNVYYPEYKDTAPYNLITDVNLYALGSLEIHENVLTSDTKKFDTGPIGVIPTQTLDENASYLEVLYTSVPGLMIHSLTVNDEGNFVVDALIPQTTVITEKD